MRGKINMNGYENKITWEMALLMNNDYGIYHRIKGDSEPFGEEDLLEILSDHLDWDEMEEGANWNEIFEVVKEIQG